MSRLWNRLFLDEHSSIGLAFFRIAVAVTVGFHVLPTFCQLDDNYLHTAFKIYNANFFPMSVLQLVGQSPDWLVILFVYLFCIFWFLFLIGLWTQVSCILMTLTCYYFYALNSFHIGTLSWDILLVTLFLICLTPYPGDYFSIDCLRKGDERAYRRERPFFLQRLLQMQIAFTYFYTALYKITAEGNWLTANPIYYLMNYPPEGTMKYFILKDFLFNQPQLCYVLGILIVTIEILMPFLLFYPKTRLSAIYLGFLFHITLLLTLDVPAIFFFLFPPQLLLFIHPRDIVRFIEQKRLYNESAPRRNRLIWDGHCGFCARSVQILKVMDLFSTLKFIDFHEASKGPGGLKAIHPDLTEEMAKSRIYLIEPDEKMYGGFQVFRRICFTMPMLYPTIFIVYFPGMGILGPKIYDWVAGHRYLFHLSPVCKDNSCYR